MLVTERSTCAFGPAMPLSPSITPWVMGFALSLNAVVARTPTAQAQTLLPDPTLSSTVTTDSANRRFSVTGGSLQGANLFHSFTTFSPADWSVLFDLTSLGSSGNNIERVFSRVTGNEISDINGVLSLVGGRSPDLFLLNPNGIIFGPNARLNLASSFIGTTAEAIQFADGARFNSVPAQSTPQLSISVPTGLQLGKTPGSLSVLGQGHQLTRPSSFSPLSRNATDPVRGLQVAPGKTLALIGGDIQLDGGVLEPSYAPSTSPGATTPLGGHLWLGAIADSMLQLQPTSLGWDFTASPSANYRDIQLSNRSWLDASGDTPSSITLLGNNITLASGSVISMNYWGQTAPNGALTLQAAERLSIVGEEQRSSEVQTNALASGQGGELKITANQLQLLNGANVSANTYGSATSGSVTVDVLQDIQINGVTDGSSVTQPITILSSSSLGTGNAGPLNVKTQTLAISNGGLLSSSTLSEGAGGSLVVEADHISLAGINPLSFSPASISSASFGSGNAGQSIAITTKTLDISSGAVIQASAYGAGNAGNIDIEATESVTLSGPRLGIASPGEIGSNAVESIPGLENFIDPGPLTGNSGNVSIRTPQLSLNQGGQVTVTNEGEGRGGNIQIAAQTIRLNGGAGITASTEVGQGGSIQLQVDDSILLRDNSQIAASALGKDGDGGNIDIQARQLVAVPQENNDITANAVNRFGGNISIDATAILGLSAQAQDTPNSDITASSKSGAQFSGTVEITQPKTTPAQGLTVLPDNVGGSEDIPIARACNANPGQFASQGRGGLPLSPKHRLDDFWVTASSSAAIAQAQTLRSRGFYPKALAILQRETKALESLPPSEQTAIALRQLGITYNLLEQLDSAKAALEQSLAIAQSLQLAEQISATHLSLGNLAMHQGQTSSAASHYQRALDSAPTDLLKTKTLANQLALTLSSSAPTASHSASELLHSLQTQLSQHPLDRDYLEIRLNVAAQLLEQSVIPFDSPEFLRQTLEQAKALGDPRAIAYAAGYLGQAYGQSQQWEQAQALTETALLDAQTQQDSFQEYQWAWQLGRILRSRAERSNPANVAVRNAWRSQSEVAYETALAALKQLRGELATVSPRLQFSFKTQVEPVYREFVSLLLSPARSNPELTSPKSASHQPQSSSSAPNISPRSLQKSLETIEALKLAELDNFLNDTCLTARPRSIEQLDPNAAVIYPILLDDRLEVIFSHRGKLMQQTLAVSPEQLETTVRDLQQKLVTRSRRDYQQPSQQIYEWLIRPLLPKLNAAGVETLVFIPDGPLANIPLAALFDGEQFLMEQFNVAIAPSLQLLPSQTTPTLKPEALVAGISKANQGFGALEYVEQELRNVESLLPAQTLINENFTRKSLEKSLLESQTPIVHIATHGQFSSKASDTFIAAWDERIDIVQLHQLLSSRDRNQLSPTELLILSACETALGDEAATLGLAGIAVRAGARSTVASLWNIDDASTAFLMQQFYYHLSQQSLSKAEALRAAQQALLDHPVYNHPYYWSAFVLMGNWQ